MPSFIDEINAERAKQGKPLVPVAETPYASDLTLENAAKAFGYGVLDFGNSLFLGGLAQASKNLGRIPEWLNWTSGESISPEGRARLIRSGYSPAEIDQMFPYEKSWLSQGGDILAKQGAINKETIGNWETEALGDNPSTVLRSIRGTGTTLGSVIAGIAAALATGGNPLAGAAAMGAIEAGAESGGVTIDAQRKGLLDNGGVGAANNTFLANVVLNTMLDYTLGGPFGRFAGKVKNPVARFGTRIASEVTNELLQETTQGVIEQAANNQMDNGTNFLPELGKEFTKWPDYFSEVAPETALSTLMTSLFTGGVLGSMSASIPGGIRNEFHINDMLKYGQEQAPQVQSDIENFLKLREQGEVVDGVPPIAFTQQQNEELSNLQNDISSVIQNLTPDSKQFIGYNSPSALYQNLTHLENIRQTISNYGKSADEIRTQKIQEIQAQQAARQAEERARQKAREEERKAKEAIDKARAERSILKDTSDIAENSENNNTEITTTAGTKANVRYRVVEGEGLITSHNMDGVINPDYDQRLQQRDRSSQISLQQINNIANNIDPKRLTSSYLITEGAPVVDKHGVVISGNGRTNGILKAYKQGTGESYRQHIMQNAASMGLNPDRISKLRKPIVVRELTSEIKDMPRFAAEANEATTPGNTSAATAMADAKRIPSSVLTSYDPTKKIGQNSEFVGEVMSYIPFSEKPNLFTKDGDISPDGENRISRMLTAKAYNDKDLVENLERKATGNIKDINEALIEAAPYFAKFEGSGIRPDLSIAEDIVQAYSLLTGVKNKGETIESNLATDDLFPTYTEEAKKIAAFLSGKNKKGKTRSAAVLRNALIRYVELASQEPKVGQNSLLDESFKVSKAEYLDEALTDVVKRETNGEDTSTEDTATGEEVKTQKTEKEVEAKEEEKTSPAKPEPERPSVIAIPPRTESQTAIDKKQEATAEAATPNGETTTKPKKKTAQKDTATVKIEAKTKTETETKTETQPSQEESKPKTEAEIEEALRKEVEEQVIAVGHSEDEAKAVSDIYIKGQKTIAQAAGISLEASVRADGLQIKYKSTLPNNDKASITFKDGETIIKVSKLADESSIIHEMGHLFFNKIKNLILTKQLKEGNTLRNDFAATLKFYGVTMKDFINETDNYIDAHEKFATDFERYLRKGFAPVPQLKRAFELFKKWLRAIYTEAVNLKYKGADGEWHKFSLNKDTARKLLDHLLGSEEDTSRSISVEEENDVLSVEDTDAKKKKTKVKSFAQASENAPQTAEQAQNSFKDWLTAKDYTRKKLESIKSLVREEVAQREEKGDFKLSFRDLEAEARAKAEAEAKAKEEAESKKKGKRGRKGKSKETETVQGNTPSSEQTPSTVQNKKAVNNAPQTQQKEAPSVINHNEEKTPQNTLKNAPSSEGTEKVDTNAPFTWGNEETERSYKHETGIKSGVIKRIKESALNMIKNFGKGSFAELQVERDDGVDLYPAKTMLDRLDRNIHRRVDEGIEELSNNLSVLDTSERRDLFIRKRIADNLAWRINDFKERGLEPPKLPFGWTPETFAKDYERLNQICEKDNVIMNAIKAEEKSMANIASEFTELAGELGFDVKSKFRNPHYFHHAILEYMGIQSGARASTLQGREIQDIAKTSMKQILGRDYFKKYKGSEKDISTDYAQIMGETRVQLLTDMETMRTLVEIKKKYDITEKIRENYEALQSEANEEIDEDGETFSQASDEKLDKITEKFNKVIPDGYSIFSPAGSGLIQGTNTVAENAYSQAFNELSDKSGVPFDDILAAIDGLLSGNGKILEQSMIIPDELKSALKKLARRRNRNESVLGRTARRVTSFWKADVIYNPLRVIKYNIRNYTGDLDAFIAGLGMGKRERANVKQSFKELRAHRKSKGKTASPELKAYLSRSEGRMKVQSLDVNNDKIALNKSDKNDKLYKKFWNGTANITKRFFNWEMELTQYRENHLRYAAFLTFLQDMKENNGVPSRWAASNQREILALNDIYDRAYEMANDLMGAYDKISDMGRELRSFLAPFWSWQEVNMKRYCRLLKNGFKGNNQGAFLRSLAIAKSAKIPYYAVNAIGVATKIALVTALTSAWNRLLMGNANDKLPEDVIYRPHFTIGEWGGKVRYFDRIGSLADALDWGSFDSLFLDIAEKANGKLSWLQWAKKIGQAPFNKAIGQINFLLKMPIELATGRSLYPDAFKSRTITDPLEHIARSFAVEWPYKWARRAVTHQSYSNEDELWNMVIYSIEPEEAAYFNALDAVRTFSERVLDKHFDGSSSTQKGKILRNFKRSLFYDDTEAASYFLREYHKLDGTAQGLKQSLKAMHPLFGLNEKDKKEFMKWATPEDKKNLKLAERYWRKLTRRFL